METIDADREQLLDAEALAQILGVSKLSIYRWARLGQVPYLRFGPKILRFRLKDFKTVPDRSLENE